MARLLIRGLLFVALNGVFAVALLKAHESRLALAPWESDSILLQMPEDAQHAAVFLGSSHAYLLGRFRDHIPIIEEAAGGPVFNMALPSGGGLRPAYLYLEEYFAQGNHAERVVYFIDPFVFYGTGANDAHKFVYDEPLRFSFLAKMLRDGYPFRRVLTYVRSKFAGAWLFQEPEVLIAHPGALTAAQVDSERIQMRIDSLYVDGVEEENFARYASYLERIVALAEEHGSAMYLIVPPTLLGAEPGAERMAAYLDELSIRHTVVVRDWHDAMPDPAHYYNLDHLNTAGVQHFTSEFLNPLFAE